MPNWKLYVTSGIFVLVTVLKLLMPDATAQARQEIVALIDMDMDYRNMITQVGSILTDESVQQVVSRFKGEVQAVIGDNTEMPTPSPSVSAEPSVPATAEVIPTPTLSVSPEPTVTPTPAPTTEIPASVQAAVQAFNLAQEAYVGYETPDEELDLDYCKEAVRMDVPYAMSNSLGFGGHNATLLLKKYEA